MSTGFCTSETQRFTYIHISFLLHTHVTSASMINITFKINNRVQQYIIVERLTTSGTRDDLKIEGSMLTSYVKDHDMNVQIHVQTPQGIVNLHILASRIFGYLVLVVISLLLRRLCLLRVLIQNTKQGCLSFSHDSLSTS